MNKLVKAGVTALSALSIAGGAVTTVTTIVETVNYQNIHEATVEDIYRINGVEVDEESFLSLQQSDAEETPIIYYGAVDSLNEIVMEELTCVELPQLSQMNASDIIEYRCKISAGNFETEEGQYPIFILPKDYALFTIRASGIEIPMEAITVGNYRIYYFPDASVDAFYGGINYIFEIIQV